MAIIKTVYADEFVKEFDRMDRSENFTVEGRNALYDWLNDWYDNETYELDIIALCCEFSEYKTLDEFHNDYDKNKYPDLETIQDYTIVIQFENGFIIGEL